ncbi:MAG: sigma-54 dependent transcriptional regulator [Gemmataceae bacterium]|nr:sigma-54 dependent transcriptional regulator [Gemmataceae bacterium]
MPTLLVVDDEPAIRHAFQRAFRDGDIAVRTAETAAEAVAAVERDRPDVVVLDVHLPDASGLETFHRLKAVDARIPVVLVTGHGTTDLAIEAMKEGAFDYLLKPLELADLRELIGRAVRSARRMTVPAALPEDPPPPDGGDVLVGRVPAMQEVYKAVGRVAGQDVTVLLLGESGTGKELVARAVYQHSARADKPFVAINCGAIPENLVESELFGHERGAFTGADRRRVGKFEQAHGGTVLLDEVGELPPAAQVKMLRVLQEGRFERVGGEEAVTADVRVIAATNADLEKMAEDGRFRKDLFFRLNVFAIQLPPLRDRGDDLALLVDHFARRYAREFGRPAPAVAPETLAALRAYPWPGNVRELQSVLKQALLQNRGAVLLPEDLPPAVTGKPEPAGPAAGAFGWDAFVAGRIAAGSADLYAEALGLMEREVLVRVLRHTGGNQLQAAKILGITRGSLRTKIRSLGISIRSEVWSDDDQGDSG